MNNYKELKVWQKSIELTTDIYKATRLYPSEEKFGIISQINRSAVSVASNIAEGAGRGTKGEFKQFLSMAKASCYELETQLIISNNIGYLNTMELDKFVKSIEEIGKMITGLQKSLSHNS